MRQQTPMVHFSFVVLPYWMRQRIRHVKRDGHGLELGVSKDLEQMKDKANIVYFEKEKMSNSVVNGKAQLGADTIYISHLGTLNEFSIQRALELSLSSPRYGVHRDRILKHSLHSFSSDEDEFSELGLPVLEGEGTRLNLVTEKPRKSSSLIKLFEPGRLSHGKENPKINSLPPKQGKEGVALNLVDENDSEVLRAHEDTQKQKLKPRNRSSKSVIIGKIPSTISLDQLKSAVSSFGEILNVSVRSDHNGFTCCDVEFKTMQSKRRALSSGEIIVNLFHMPLRSLCKAENITIKVSNISLDTAEPVIHSTCVVCGPVEGLSKTKEGSVDVVFNVEDISSGNNILEKLNGMFVDNSKWSAEILAESKDEAVTDVTADAPTVQQEAGSELTKFLEDVQRQYQMKKVYLEDLVLLHQAIMHLQEHPAC
ncbi:hypothetical protein IFM89_003884 [Coptis chinensis]|uniref:RRM domain-containing protein n=1 Tax=Coptis chinensis TaxID=261450 RepID=A0A835HZK6_9MAGN|nr:hypothetical protein IFM89_003884 [Coptis chinensis]